MCIDILLIHNIWSSFLIITKEEDAASWPSWQTGKDMTFFSKKGFS